MRKIKLEQTSDYVERKPVAENESQCKQVLTEKHINVKIDDKFELR